MPSRFQMPTGKRWVPVTIQAMVGTLDSAGQETQTWQAFQQAFAAIEPLTGRELLAAGAIHAEASVLITLRWIPGITAKMRVVYVDGAETHTYHIHAALNVEMRNRLWQLYCAERPLETAAASD